MGLLSRLMRTPSEEPWRPPLTGACACPDHRATIMDVVIDADPPIAVKDLAPDAITVVESSEHYLYDASNWRRGPYQWRLTYAPPLTTAYDADAPASIDDMLFAQPGIDNLLRLDETTLAVGAAEMCADGIGAAFLTALANPRVRRADGTPPSEPAGTPGPARTCTCAEHVEDLLEESIPLNAEFPDEAPMAVRQFVEDVAWVNGAHLLGDDEPGDFEADPGMGDFLVELGDEARMTYDDDAPGQVDKVLAEQPSVTGVIWEDREVLWLRAPTMCASGVLAATVRTLQDPRVRT